MQPPRTPSGSRGTLVFTFVAVVALGSTVLATGLGGGAQKELAAERAKLRAECTSMPGANPCARYPQAVLPAFTQNKQELAAADQLLLVGDRATAAQRLAQVLASADAIDRQHTLAASLVAGSLIDEVGKRVDASSALLDQPVLAAALRRTAFSSALHPLAGERLEAQARLSRVPSEMPIRTAGFAERATVTAMTDVDAALRAMEAAALAKDDAKCQAAATSTTGLAKQVTVGPGICALASSVVASGARLADLRARANARIYRTRTAAVRL